MGSAIMPLCHGAMVGMGLGLWRENTASPDVEGKHVRRSGPRVPGKQREGVSGPVGGDAGTSCSKLHNHLTGTSQQKPYDLQTFRINSHIIIFPFYHVADFSIARATLPGTDLSDRGLVQIRQNNSVRSDSACYQSMLSTICLYI